MRKGAASFGLAWMVIYIMRWFWCRRARGTKSAKPLGDVTDEESANSHLPQWPDMADKDVNIVNVNVGRHWHQ